MQSACLALVIWLPGAAVQTEHRHKRLTIILSVSRCTMPCMMGRDFMKSKKVCLTPAGTLREQGGCATAVSCKKTLHTFLPYAGCGNSAGLPQPDCAPGQQD